MSPTRRPVLDTLDQTLAQRRALHAAIRDSALRTPRVSAPPPARAYWIETWPGLFAAAAAVAGIVWLRVEGLL